MKKNFVLTLIFLILFINSALSQREPVSNHIDMDFKNSERKTEVLQIIADNNKEEIKKTAFITDKIKQYSFEEFESLTKVLVK